MEGIVWFMLIWQTAILPNGSTADARLLLPRVTFENQITCKVSLNDLIDQIERNEAHLHALQTHVYGKCMMKAPDSFYIELLDVDMDKQEQFSTFVTDEVPSYE